MRLLPLPGVFQPPSDAWMLTQSIDEVPLDAHSRVLDLCTGSGVLAIHAALRGAGDVTAVDVSRRAAVAVRLNARLNGVHVRSLRGDLFGPVAHEHFDLIVSNPPYLPGPSDPPQRGLARAWEAGPRGRTFLDRICDGAAAHLRPGGRILLVHSSLCSEDETMARLEAVGLSAQVVARFPGPLGPILTSREQWLRDQGLLGPELREDIVIVCGHAVSARAASSHRERQRPTPLPPPRAQALRE